MSLENVQGDTEYYASTDYNQRLEEKAEAEYEEKTTSTEERTETADGDDLDTLIAEKNFNALYELAAKVLNEEEMLKLSSLRDKDIQIALARNEHITDAVAQTLIGTVYLAHKALLMNPSVSQHLKEQLKTRLSDNPIYQDLLQKEN